MDRFLSALTEKKKTTKNNREDPKLEAVNEEKTKYEEYEENSPKVTLRREWVNNILKDVVQSNEHHPPHRLFLAENAFGDNVRTRS